MEKDVSKTLMINMVEMSNLFTRNLGDLTTEWKLFTQVRMPVILEKYGELSFADQYNLVYDETQNQER